MIPRDMLLPEICFPREIFGPRGLRHEITCDYLSSIPRSVHPPQLHARKNNHVTYIALSLTSARSVMKGI